MKTLWEYCADFQFAYVDKKGVAFFLNTAAYEEAGELVEGPRPSDKYVAGGFWSLGRWVGRNSFGFGPRAIVVVPSRASQA